jgi:hypothetical protein
MDNTAQATALAAALLSGGDPCPWLNITATKKSH